MNQEITPEQMNITPIKIEYAKDSLRIEKEYLIKLKNLKNPDNQIQRLIKNTKQMIRYYENRIKIFEVKN